MEMCAVTESWWAALADTVAYAIVLIIAVAFCWRTWHKSPLERTIERLTVDALEDIVDFLESPIGGEEGKAQYLTARFGRLQLALEDAARDSN